MTTSALVPGKLLDQDFKKISKKIEQFISEYVSKNSKGLVIGLSGGLDSSVLLKLIVNALGPNKILGIVMPASSTPKQDIDDAIDYAKELGIKYKVIDLEPIVAKYLAVLPNDRKARGNLTARMRMSVLYYYAAINGYLVAGTSDKSELVLGYSTKFGDGAADIMPIADLYKTQVRKLALFLDMPAAIVKKKSSPRLWDNHLAEEEIGMSYETIDPILHLLVDKKTSAQQISKKLGIPLKDVNKVQEMVNQNAHKRKMPETVKIR